MRVYDRGVRALSQEWLNRYELEYYLHYKVLSLHYRYEEMAVWKRYPADGLPTSKIRLTRDSWSLLRPLVLLTLSPANLNDPPAR